jgi:hypothetical protein
MKEDETGASMDNKTLVGKSECMGQSEKLRMYIN